MLSVAVADSFHIVYNPMNGNSTNLDRTIKKLSLPRSVVNIRIKLNQSNPVVIIAESNLAIAGVRRDIFVWNLTSEKMVR